MGKMQEVFKNSTNFGLKIAIGYNTKNSSTLNFNYNSSTYFDIVFHMKCQLFGIRSGNFNIKVPHFYVNVQISAVFKCQHFGILFSNKTGSNIQTI